jgi:hypothetical protein
VIAVAVRWYLRYGLSYRDVEELLAERGISVDHVTIYRWVQTFTSEFIDAARPARHAVRDRWFVDEVRHEALVRREALETEGGASPPRRVVAAALVGAERSPIRETPGRAGSSADKAGTGWHCQTVRVRRARSDGIREEPVVKLRKRGTGSNLVDMGRGAVHDHRLGGRLRSRLGVPVGRPR